MMIKRGMVLAVLFAVPASAWGDAEELARFKKEFPPAVKRLEERFARVKATCRVWNTNVRDPNPARIDDANFAIDHGHEKVTIQRKLPHGTADSPHADLVYCFGDDALFEVMRLPGEKEFLLTGAGSTLLDQSKYTNGFWQFVKAHYGIAGRSFSQIMASPNFRLINAERIAKGGNALVKVEYQVGGEKPDRVSVVFDPDANWAVQSSETRPGRAPKRRFTTAVEYGPPRDGLPMPKRVVTSIMEGEMSYCEFSDWSFDPTPKAEFTLPYYGLPDLLAKAATPRRTLPYWLAGIAALGLAVAFALRRLGTRPMSPARV